MIRKAINTNNYKLSNYYKLCFRQIQGMAASQNRISSRSELMHSFISSKDLHAKLNAVVYGRNEGPKFL